MAIELEKILNITATEYAEIEYADLEDYVAVGVHSKIDKSNGLKEYLSKVPDQAEVVVNFRLAGVGDYYLMATGTALIPTDAYERMQSEKPIKEQ